MKITIKTVKNFVGYLFFHFIMNGPFNEIKLQQEFPACLFRDLPI